MHISLMPMTTATAIKASAAMMPTIEPSMMMPTIKASVVMTGFLGFASMMLLALFNYRR
jgi:hypothetical protein